MLDSQMNYSRINVIAEKKIIILDMKVNTDYADRSAGTSIRYTRHIAISDTHNRVQVTYYLPKS